MVFGDSNFENAVILSEAEESVSFCGKYGSFDSLRLLRMTYVTRTINPHFTF